MAAKWVLRYLKTTKDYRLHYNSTGPSALETEYIACSEASREGHWLLQLYKDLDKIDLELLPIHCDSQGALSHITNGIIKARTKYVDVCYHNSRHLYDCGIVNYFWVSADGNTAYIISKAFR
jgi:hypothetical protein